MSISDSRAANPSSLLQKTGSVLAVIGCFALVEWIASFHFLVRILPLPSSLSLGLAWHFEHQVWQFGIAMLAITILSRGHLWSYGINSSEIRLSMAILLKFYAAGMVLIVGLIVLPLLLSGTLPPYFTQMSRTDMVVWILFQWMAAAIGDEIFFHGLCQTLLLKYWRGKFVVKSFEVPFVVLLTSVAFAIGRSNVLVYGNHWLEYLLALLIGLYGGLVYYRTRSLLTPMLSQAFFYGFPFVVRFIYLAMTFR
jgi:membrane protease YdiL (CAAX protease family)